MNTWDAIIIGGGIIGLSTGYYLARNGKKVLLLERRELGAGSTSRCIGGIRQQFSTPGSIRLAMKSVELFSRMEEEFGFSVEFAQTGYLFLIFTEEQKRHFLEVMQLQKSLGLEVYFLEKKDVEELVPGIDSRDLMGGVYSPKDGQAYPFAVLKGMAEGIMSQGGEVKRRTEVVGIIQEGGRVKGVLTGRGEKFYAPVVVNAAGPWAKQVGQMADVELPTEPERHEAFITARLPYRKIPMIVDYRPDGGYFQQRINGQIIGCYTPKPRVPGPREDSSFEFIGEMSYRIVRVIPWLKNSLVLRQWAGAYTMTPDGSPIIDETELEGFFVAVGMSGHGFMFGPAVGWSLAGKIVQDEWPLPMEEFSLRREFSSEEALK